MATDKKTYELTVESRDETGKMGRKLRRTGLVPGVVYGHKVDSLSVQVPMRDLERVYMRAGSNSLIDLKVGRDDSRKVFIYKVQRDPVTHNLRHVDFMVVNLREEITTSVPLVLVGESPAVDNGEGIVLQSLDSVQVRCLPMDLPNIIEVDISVLATLGDTIHVSDLKLAGNVAILTSEEELVAKIAELRVEEVEEVEEADEAEEGAETEAEANAEGGDNSDLPNETA